MKPYATLWFATNTLPNLRDLSPATLEKRCILVELNRSFQGESRDARLIDKLTEELPEPPRSRRADERHNRPGTATDRGIAPPETMTNYGRLRVTLRYDNDEEKLMGFVRTMALILLACLSASAGAQMAKGKYPACSSKDTYDKLMSAVVSNDADTVSAYLGSGRCVMLPAGSRITVSSLGIFGASEIVYRGVTLFTVSEEISR